jgi:hypothetical protein
VVVSVAERIVTEATTSRVKVSSPAGTADPLSSNVTSGAFLSMWNVSVIVSERLPAASTAFTTSVCGAVDGVRRARACTAAMSIVAESVYVREVFRPLAVILISRANALPSSSGASTSFGRLRRRRAPAASCRPMNFEVAFGRLPVQLVGDGDGEIVRSALRCDTCG